MSYVPYKYLERHLYSVLGILFAMMNYIQNQISLSLHIKLRKSVQSAFPFLLGMKVFE